MSSPAPSQALGSLASAPAGLGKEGLRAALFAAILLIVWISTSPFFLFSSPGAKGEDTSNVFNQIVFLTLAIAVACAAATRDLRLLRPFLQPSYLLLVVWLLLSLTVSIQPGDAFRALAFSLVVMFIAAGLFSLPRDGHQLVDLLALVAGLTLATAWLGVLVLPEAAIHTDWDPVEPEHAGSWRGHFPHKNIAGAMMAVLAILGIHAFRSGRRWTGAAIVIGAVAFLYLTRSKTSFGLLPLAVMVGFAAEWARPLVLRLAIILGPVIALNLLTLGSAFDARIAAFNKWALKDPTFTGRFDIWRYGFEKLAERPWSGFGFDSFWLTEWTLKGESKLELGWGVEHIIHGHNAYLDIMLTLGVPGLAIVAWVFLVKPAIDFHRCRPTPENRRLATACLMILVFVSLGNCLEMFYLRRVDPVWFALLFAVFGLRMAASYPLAGRS